MAEYQEILRVKQGGSKERAKRHWNEAQKEAKDTIGQFSPRDLLILMSGIYWGEGTKASLALVNGDPYLIRSFIQGLLAMGVNKNDVRLNFRIFSDTDEDKIIDYWLKFLNFNRENVGRSEIIKGNGTNKLQYGMCRVRVLKGARHFKQVMSMIDLMKSSIMPL